MRFSLQFSLPVAAVCVGLAKAQTSGIGNLFYFSPKTGACGFTNTSTEFVASVSETVFDNYPGATPNPNDNPICTHNLTVTYNGTNASAQIVDYYTSSPETNVGFSAAAFEAFDVPPGLLENGFGNVEATG